jgi:hypothetical protein
LLLQVVKKLDKCPVCKAPTTSSNWKRHLNIQKHSSAIFVKYGTNLDQVPLFLRPPVVAQTAAAAPVPQPVSTERKAAQADFDADSVMAAESDARGVHASEGAVPRVEPGSASSAGGAAGRWEHIEAYFPWKYRERLELDMWRTAFGISDEAFLWLLRTLGQSWFKTARVWRSLDEYEREQQQIPRPAVIQRQASCIVNGKSGPQHAVIAEFSIIDTLKRLLADPLVRATINLDARDLRQPPSMSDFLDTPYSRNPLATADSVGFYIPGRDDINSAVDGRIVIGDCAEVKESKEGKRTTIVRVVKLNYDGSGKLSVECEKLVSSRALQQLFRTDRVPDPLVDIMQLENELFLVRSRSSFAPDQFVRRVDVSSVGGSGEFVCAWQFKAKALAPCDFDKLRNEFTVSLPVTLASGKVFWIILYIDGVFALFSALTWWILFRISHLDFAIWRVDCSLLHTWKSVP